MPAESASSAAAGAAEAAAPAGLDALLGAQEFAADSPRDRAARRHGQESLKLLRSLQVALLVGDTDPGTLAQLAEHVAAMPAAEHPGLAAVQRAIAQRVAVELARRTPHGNRFP